MSEYGALQHEEVVIRRGRRTGAAITVAVHSRALGAAVGGCRIWTYPSWREGTADAMRLAEAMTYKCAAAGLEFGGGKTRRRAAERDGADGRAAPGRAPRRGRDRRHIRW